MTSPEALPMQTAPLRTFLDRLRRDIGPSGAPGPTDAQLLERWVARRDEASFELLLYRHGPAVLGACRRLLNDPHTVEDCFQATFVALVRKAGSIGRREAVGPWLYQVARRAALRVRAETARRAERERPGDEALAAVPAGDTTGGTESDGVLDEEVARLPRKYREAVVLCWLGGRTIAEAARELGCPPGTVSARLSRARKRLRQRLARRGPGVAAALAAGTLAGNGVAAVPPLLAQAVLGMALACKAGCSEVAAATRAAALAEGVLKSMPLTRLKAAMTVALALLLLTLGAATVLPQSSAEERPLPPSEGAKNATAKWEYKALDRKEVEALTRSKVMRTDQKRLLDGLNSLGSEGWELAGIEPGQPRPSHIPNIDIGPTTYVFKREKK
jgi:RNA polymerase sigma factor (sigma-70 family)